MSFLNRVRLWCFSIQFNSIHFQQYTFMYNNIHLCIFATSANTFDFYRQYTNIAFPSCNIDQFKTAAKFYQKEQKQSLC